MMGKNELPQRREEMMDFDNSIACVYFQYFIIYIIYILSSLCIYIKDIIIVIIVMVCVRYFLIYIYFITDNFNFNFHFLSSIVYRLDSI